MEFQDQVAVVPAVRGPDVSAGVVIPGVVTAMCAGSGNSKGAAWDEVTMTVAQAVVRHLPDATATEAEYHLVLQHLGRALWRLGVAHLALQALGGVLRERRQELRALVVDAPGTTGGGS